MLLKISNLEILSKNSQIWNEHSNLNKFSTKPDSRRRSTFKIFRRPSSNIATNSIATNSPASGSNASSSLSTPASLAVQPTSLVDTVSKVATQIVDQSLNTINSSTSSLLSLTSGSTTSGVGILSSSSFLNEPSSLVDFNQSLNRLMSSSLNESASSATSTSLAILIPTYAINGSNNTNNKNLLSASNGAGSSSSDFNSSALLNEFEDKFKIYFSQL